MRRNKYIPAGNDAVLIRVSAPSNTPRATSTPCVLYKAYFPRTSPFEMRNWVSNGLGDTTTFANTASSTAVGGITVTLQVLVTDSYFSLTAVVVVFPASIPFFFSFSASVAIFGLF